MKSMAIASVPASRTVTAVQMREADRRCIQELGIPGAVLMYNAGEAVFREIQHGPVGIVCGKGNNGGDGFVVACLARAAGLDPRVVLLWDPSDLTEDAGLYLRAYRRLGGALRVACDEADVLDAMRGLAACSTLVDAVLGTGITGEVRGPARAAIGAWPTGPVTLAVDLPSGMDADTGAACGACVTATTTVTLQFAKRGFEAPGAAAYLGRLIVADIGIPAVCADDTAWERLRSTWI